MMAFRDFSDIVVYNSVTNNLDDQKIDLLKPFSFLEFLNYSTESDNDSVAFQRFERYLQLWGETTNLTNISFDALVRQEYITFLKEISLKFTTNEEKRFLSNIDINDDESLTVALPFYVKKIKQIILYYKNKRDTFKKESRISKNKGSVKNIKDYIKTQIIDFFTGDDLSPDLKSGLSLEQLQTNVSIDLEENYDNFNDYYDLDPTKDPSIYNAENDRLSYFTSNTNYISGNEFLDLDKAIKDVLTDKRLTLSELNEFSPIVEFETDLDESLLDNTDYQDYRKTTRDNLKLLLHAELAKTLLGTDFYYLSTDIKGNTLSGELFESKNKVLNLPNTLNPTSLTVPSYNLLSERSVGVFFKPTNYSILKMEGSFSSFLRNDLKKDKVYVFPNPSQYGNISGLSKSMIDNPFGFISKRSEYRNESSSFGQRLPKKFSNEQGFYSYDSLEQKRNNYSNLSSFFDSKTSNFLDKGVLDEVVTDIFGNKFVTYISDNFYEKYNYLDNFVNDKTIFNGSNTLTSFKPTNNKKLTVPEKAAALKDIFVINVSTNEFIPLSSSFKQLFNKYSNIDTLSSEIFTNHLQFNIFENVYSIKTTNFSIIDSFNYNGNFLVENTFPLILRNTSGDINSVSNTSNDFVFNDKIYKVQISLTPSSSADNNTFFYEFIQYDLKKNISEKIISKENKNLSFFEDNFSLNLDTKVKKIKNVYLSHNSKLGLFNLLVNYLDLNENIYIHSLTYYFKSNDIIIIDNSLYKPQNYVFTSNFFNTNNFPLQYTSVSLSGGVFQSNDGPGVLFLGGEL